jgi:hypothetical protein
MTFVSTMMRLILAGVITLAHFVALILCASNSLLRLHTAVVLTSQAEVNGRLGSQVDFDS